MRVQLEFSEELTGLTQPISTLELAIDEILDCETLTEIFLVMLTAGNIINGVCSPSHLSLSLSLSLSLTHTHRHTHTHTHTHVLTCTFKQGSYAGGAYGFKVDSLSRLKETKSKNAAMSFLHYVSEVCIHIR